METRETRRVDALLDHLSRVMDEHTRMLARLDALETQVRELWALAYDDEPCPVQRA